MRSPNSYAGLSRITLKAWAFALGLTAVIMAAVLIWMLTRPLPRVLPPERLPVDDVMLLTREEMLEACVTGVACYTYQGVYYVNASLSEDYYNAWIHE